jgi:hypothetical protein
MIVRATIIILLMLALLAGCRVDAVLDPRSPYYRMPVGSRITLNQELQVPGERTRIFLQRGQVLSDGFDQYYPHCNFEIRTLSEDIQTIVPDDFLVVRVNWGINDFVKLDSIMLASIMLLSFGYSDSIVSHYVDHYLSSEVQPDVMFLTCYGAFDFPSEADPPTIAEIREALGNVATLHLKK